MLVLPFFTLLLLTGSSSTADDEGPVVETPLGKLRGYTSISRSGREFLAFSGIPYAKPPVGELRFKPPEVLPAWHGIKDAMKEDTMCIQFISDKRRSRNMGQEDCLYLSVFTHNISGNAPVLIHIHGGAYSMGYKGDGHPHFLMDEDIVVVTVNYRLGIFGFLSFETSEMPGNQGVKDQLMALRWVQQNIASFGGDPNLVTIIGESAGGASVYNHIISPLSKGLFHRAISESGTSYGIWAVAPPGYARSNAQKLMTLIDCPVNPEEAIPCVTGKDAMDIASKGVYFMGGLVPFGPVIEAPGPDSFIVGLPSEWNHNPVPLIIGTDSAEGLLVTSKYTVKDFDFKKLSENYNKIMPPLLGYSESASNPDEITNEIRSYYLPNKDITVKDFVNLTMVVSDCLFTVPITDGANTHKGDVYFYYFDYKIPIPGIDEKFIIGATHVAEAGLIWNVSADHYPPITDKKTENLSEKLVRMVSTFMKTGVPVIEGSGVSWETWTSENHNYIHIDSEGFHLKKGLAEDRYNFWKSLNYRDKYRKA